MGSDRDLGDPYDDQAVRSLLAGAGPLSDAERLPGEVAARLDARLDALVAERGARARRRRRGRLLLVAAAVVMVAGVGVPVVRGLGGGTAGDATSDSGGRAASRTQAESPSNASPGSAGVASGEPSGPAVPALTSAGFDRQVGRLLASENRREVTDQAPPGCAGTSRRRYVRREIDQRIPITFDGTPALLEVHVRRDRLTRVDAVTCDGALLDSTNLG